MKKVRRKLSKPPEEYNGKSTQVLMTSVKAVVPIHFYLTPTFFDPVFLNNDKICLHFYRFYVMDSLQTSDKFIRVCTDEN